jgi:glutathione synthase/RimK-type ligase-like ATP-grasp enzyme
MPDITPENTADWNRFFVYCIKQYCQKTGTTLKPFSHEWLFELSNGDGTKQIIGYDIGLNSSIAYQIARDKSACSDILKAHGIPCVQHTVFFKPGSPSSLNENTDAALLDIFNTYGSAVVLKPNKGAAGVDVMKITEAGTLLDEAKRLFEKHRAIAVSPYMESSCEYRVTVLDTAVLHVYKKVRSVGDTDFRFNLAHGAIAESVSIVDAQKAGQLALDTLHAIGGRFMNIDILETQRGLQVIEANGTVAFEKYARTGAVESMLAESVYSRALDALFNRTEKAATIHTHV